MAKTCLTWLSPYKMYGGSTKSDEFRPKNLSHAGPAVAADGWFLRRTPMYGHSWLFHRGERRRVPYSILVPWELVGSRLICVISFLNSLSVAGNAYCPAQTSLSRQSLRKKQYGAIAVSSSTRSIGQDGSLRKARTMLPSHSTLLVANCTSAHFGITVRPGVAV